MRKTIMLLASLVVFAAATPALAVQDAALVLSQLRAMKGESNVLVLYQDNAFFKLNDQIDKRAAEMAKNDLVVIPTNDYDVAKQLGARNNFPSLFVLDKTGEVVYKGGVDVGLDTVFEQLEE